MSKKCRRCNGTGQVRCRKCHGTGKVGKGKREKHCPACYHCDILDVVLFLGFSAGSSGKVRCDSCGGSRKVGLT